MLRVLLLLGVLISASLATGPLIKSQRLVVRSAEAAAPLDYQGLADALTRTFALPRYERLRVAAEGLSAPVAAFCAEPASEAAFAALAAAYGEVWDAWAAVEALRFGPVTFNLRLERFESWPDPRDSVGAQLAAMIEARDREALMPHSFAQRSVAVQGLTALERLLFDEGARAALAAGDEGAAYRCDLLGRLAANMAEMAGDILADWTGGERPFVATVAAAEEGNDYYYTAREAALEYLQSLATGLQFVGEHKLLRVMGESPAQARPHRLEGWRSERAAANIRINIAALEALYRGGDGLGFDDLLASRDPELAGLMARAFRQTRATADNLPVPLAAALGDPAARPTLEKLETELRALRQIVERRVAPALDMTLGFNALDGD